MDMRDKIAAEHDRIIHATIDEPCSYKRSVFRAGWDAHKAALPDMIAPLVWEYNELRAEFISGAYCIALDGPDPTLFIAWAEDGLPFMFICDAKAAADALNLAAIMAAFNQPKEPT